MGRGGKGAFLLAGLAVGMASIMTIMMNDTQRIDRADGQTRLRIRHPACGQQGTQDQRCERKVADGGQNPLHGAGCRAAP